MEVAEKGYAQALLLSPLQSPSSPSSGEILKATRLEVKMNDPVICRHPVQPTAKSCPHSYKKGPNPRQLSPDHSPDGTTKVVKSRKRSHAEYGKLEMEEERLNWTGFRKRQRWELAHPTRMDKADRLSSSVTGAQPDPITRPNSALAGRPAICAAPLRQCGPRETSSPS